MGATATARTLDETLIQVGIANCASGVPASWAAAGPCPAWEGALGQAPHPAPSMPGQKESGQLATNDGVSPWSPLSTARGAERSQRQLVVADRGYLSP